MYSVWIAILFIKIKSPTTSISSNSTHRPSLQNNNRLLCSITVWIYMTSCVHVSFQKDETNGTALFHGSHVFECSTRRHWRGRFTRRFTRAFQLNSILGSVFLGCYESDGNDGRRVCHKSLIPLYCNNLHAIIGILHSFFHSPTQFRQLIW